jgi:hypothetical protein
LLVAAGFVGVEQRTLDVPLRMPSAADALTMMREAFGAYRAVVSDSPEAVQAAAWAEVAETLTSFETSTGFVARPRCWWRQAPSRRQTGSAGESGAVDNGGRGWRRSRRSSFWRTQRRSSRPHS